MLPSVRHRRISFFLFGCCCVCRCRELKWDWEARSTLGSRSLLDSQRAAAMLGLEVESTARATRSTIWRPHARLCTRCRYPVRASVCGCVHCLCIRRSIAMLDPKRSCMELEGGGAQMDWAGAIVLTVMSRGAWVGRSVAHRGHPLEFSGPVSFVEQ